MHMILASTCSSAIKKKEAFDSIKNKLLESLASFGIPKKMEPLVKMTLEGAQAKVIVDGKINSPFVINRGVRQGDGLSATLFKLVLHKALKNLEQTNPFLNRLTQICGYADGILVIATSLTAIEAMCAEISREAGKVGLVVNPDQIYEIFSVPIPKIGARGYHKRCNL